MNPKPIKSIKKIVESIKKTGDNKEEQRMSEKLKEEEKEMQKQEVSESVDEQACVESVEKRDVCAPESSKIKEVDIKKLGEKTPVKRKKEVNFSAPTNLVAKYTIEDPSITTEKAKARLIEDLGESMSTFSNGTIASQIAFCKTFLKIIDTVKIAKNKS